MRLQVRKMAWDSYPASDDPVRAVNWSVRRMGILSAPLWADGTVRVCTMRHALGSVACLARIGPSSFQSRWVAAYEARPSPGHSQSLASVIRKEPRLTKACN